MLIFEIGVAPRLVVAVRSHQGFLFLLKSLQSADRVLAWLFAVVARFGEGQANTCSCLLSRLTFNRLHLYALELVVRIVS